MLSTALTLRNQQPQGIEQKIWGALIAYNLASAPGNGQGS
jgi:hypothetical protein